MTAPIARRLSAGQSLRNHWRVYLIEAWALGLFMISAGGFTALLDCPDSVVAGAIGSPFLRRLLIGLAMGSTAMGLIYSPWGKRSGAHMNPAITLTYLRLGQIPAWDAVFYGVFQLAGGLLGVELTAWVLGRAFTAPPVSSVVTVPGPAGSLPACAGELLISAAMMAMILAASNSRKYGRWTGLFAGLMIAADVTFESPWSGFSMNPARTLASAIPSGTWTALWIYLIAPPLGMLAAAQAHLSLKGSGSIRCCKLHHSATEACLYCGRIRA